MKRLRCWVLGLCGLTIILKGLNAQMMKEENIKYFPGEQIIGRVQETMKLGSECCLNVVSCKKCWHFNLFVWSVFKTPNRKNQLNFLNFFHVALHKGKVLLFGQIIFLSSVPCTLPFLVFHKTKFSKNTNNLFSSDVYQVYKGSLLQGWSVHHQR